MIGDFALPIRRYEPVESGQVYRMLGMRSKIGGPFIRETKSGSEISAAKLNKVKALTLFSFAADISEPDLVSLINGPPILERMPSIL